MCQRRIELTLRPGRDLAIDAEVVVALESLDREACLRPEVPVDLQGPPVAVGVAEPVQPGLEPGGPVRGKRFVNRRIGTWAHLAVDVERVATLECLHGVQGVGAEHPVGGQRSLACAAVAELAKRALQLGDVRTATAFAE